MVQERSSCSDGKNKMNAKNAGGGAVYGIGLIGALVYFIQHADTFWMGVLGVLKAIIWPAIMSTNCSNF